MLRISLLVLVTNLFLSCNFETEKTVADTSAGSVDKTLLTYANVNTNIMQPKCISCHSAAGGNGGGVNLETYATVKAASAKIKSVTVDGTPRMPPGGPLNSTLKELLGNWITAGAPETATAAFTDSIDSSFDVEE